MKFNRQEMCWEYEPPSNCYGGMNSSQGQQQSQGSGQGQSQQQSTTTPANMQNPAFQNLAPGTAGLLSLLSGGAGSSGVPGVAGVSPTSVGGVPTNSPNNPLVAPVTGGQQNTLGQIGSFLGQTPQTLAGAFSALSGEMAPNFASNLATSPQTMAAEEAAIAPIRQQFNTQTVPGLEGSFTQAGQRVGSSSDMGSSAFDNSVAAAQGNEMATEAATTGAIANNAYQTGLNITANAPAQMGSLTSSELSDLINGLNAQALPQLTQQYGISAGTQLYQTQMNTILQALGLQVQGEQPALGYFGQSTGESTESSQQSSTGSSSSSGFNIGNAFGNIFPH